MISNDDFDGKATHLNCFYLHINFEQKYPKPAIVVYAGGLIFVKYFFFQKGKGNTFTLLIIFIVKSLQKEQNSTNLLL